MSVRDPLDDQWNNPQEPERGEDEFQCECGNWMRDGDPSNVRLSKTHVICSDCAEKHPAIVGATMAGILADEFNERRR